MDHVISYYTNIFNVYYMNIQFVAKMRNNIIYLYYYNTYITIVLILLEYLLVLVCHTLYNIVWATVKPAGCLYRNH